MSGASYELHHGDCLAIMPTLAAGSVGLVLCDLPYEQTEAVWDSAVPLPALWAGWRRLLKPRGAVVLFGAQPFTSELVVSNRAGFKYEWVWEKEQGVNPLVAPHRPLSSHESVLVFYDRLPTYNPQHGKGRPYRGFVTKTGASLGLSYRPDSVSRHAENHGTRHPKSVLRFPRDRDGFHPNQKPVALLEYLIRTYTNEGDTVLDSTMGSGSTGVACVRTGRRFVGIELYPLLDRPIHPETNPDHFGTASRRIADAARELRGEFRPRTGEGEPLDGLPLFGELPA